MIVDAMNIIISEKQSVIIICTFAISTGIILTLVEAWKYYR